MPSEGLGKGTGVDGFAHKMKTAPGATLVEMFTLRPSNPRADPGLISRPGPRGSVTESHQTKQGCHEHRGGGLKALGPGKRSFLPL